MTKKEKLINLYKTKVALCFTSFAKWETAPTHLEPFFRKQHDLACVIVREIRFILENIFDVSRGELANIFNESWDAAQEQWERDNPTEK